MSRRRVGSKGFLVKVRLNITIYAENAEDAEKWAMEDFVEQMSYTGWDQCCQATRAIPGTFVERDGRDTFVDSVEELVIAPEYAMPNNGVWARREDLAAGKVPVARTARELLQELRAKRDLG